MSRTRTVMLRIQESAQLDSISRKGLRTASWWPYSPASGHFSGSSSVFSERSILVLLSDFFRAMTVSPTRTRRRGESEVLFPCGKCGSRARS
ncbi:hypothetical protein [Corynebacterium glyciniphilum]|uniref:hypothetical protein n=1 Tax=Corynebacterium glyciniphilum TaxID=1404244 RepID=UPI001642E01F|nr:hypothetical protein [Corynebacterium glyciniphilum]